jgi:hypothetical protein
MTLDMSGPAYDPSIIVALAARVDAGKLRMNWRPGCVVGPTLARPRIAFLQADLLGLDHKDGADPNR